MNPCRCRCSEQSVYKYQSKISGPLLDRIDITVAVEPIQYEALQTRPDGEPSAAIKERVERARQLQHYRFGDEAQVNARMSPAQMETYCTLDSECSALMKRAFEALNLTARSYDRIRKVARTIADLAGSEAIRPEHLAEAIQYRSFDFAER